MAGVRKLRSGTWQGWYQDHTGRRVFFTLSRHATRRQVVQAAQALEVHQAEIRQGVRPPPSLQEAALARPFAEVIADYLHWGRQHGGLGGHPWSPKHVQTRTAQLAWWQQQLGLTTLGDCVTRLPTMDRALQVLPHRPQTLAHYEQALAGFCRWCVSRGYLPSDPLITRTRRRVIPHRRRRALSIRDAQALLTHCRASFRLLYATALLTGLRVHELRQLSLDHLDLDRCGVWLQAEWTKNRQASLHPLPRDLVADLYQSGRDGTALAQYPPTTRLAVPAQPLLYVPHNTARFLRGDLARAGIPVATSAGHVDFHALRTTYVTLLLASGATVPEAQALARHRSSRMTLEVYARTEETRLQHLVDALSTAVLPETLRAPGVHAQVVGEALPRPPGPPAPLHAQPDRLRALPQIPPDESADRPQIGRIHQLTTEANPLLIPSVPHLRRAPGVHADPDLARLMAVWPTLPAPTRDAILALLPREE